MMPDLDRLQLAVGTWVAESFPGATAASIIAHLREEVGELHDAPESLRAEEAADCLLLLLTLAHHERFSLMEAAEAKHRINLTRTWERTAGDKGYRKHVEATDDAP